MKRAQIKELAQSFVETDEINQKNLDWVFANFSRSDLKLFMFLLAAEIKDKNVTVTFAGEISNKEKERIISLFPNKKILFKRDDEAVAGGVVFEYSDFVLDYSVSGIIKRILSSMRENL